MSIKNFVKEYKSKLIEFIDMIDPNVIESIIHAIENTVKTKSRIYILGNGGSAATASHMVNDLGAGLRRRKIMNLDVISLADNTPVVTAIANDIGYENIFYMQLEGLLNPNDLLIAISCSGNSPNVVKAIRYAKKQNCTVIGITGFDGGILKQISDINFHVNAEKGQYGWVL